MKVNVFSTFYVRKVPVLDYTKFVFSEMKVIAYTCCALTALYLVESNISVKKESKLIYDWRKPIPDEFVLKDLDKIKRPFCNAFTGCGRKRSFPYSKERRYKNGLLAPLYKTLKMKRNSNDRSLMNNPRFRQDRIT